MANYCRNKLTITGDLTGFLSKLDPSEGILEQLVPMPEEYGVLTDLVASKAYFEYFVSLPEEYRECGDLTEYLTKRALSEGVIERLIPMLEAYREGRSIEPIQENEQEMAQHLFEQYGARNWYDWSVANWGTDGCDVHTKYLGDGVFTFLSRFVPPHVGIRKVSALFPELTFKLEYDEPDQAFCGELVYQNGEETSIWHREGNEYKPHLYADIND